MWYYGLVFSGYKKFFLEAGCAGSSDWIYSSIWDSEARIWEGINVVSEILILRGSFSIERQWGFNLEKFILFFFVYFKMMRRWLCVGKLRSLLMLKWNAHIAWRVRGTVNRFTEFFIYQIVGGIEMKAARVL